MTTAALKQQVSHEKCKNLHQSELEKHKLTAVGIETAFIFQFSFQMKMFSDYGFHPRVQRWVIGQCLCADQRSLASYGVHRDGDTAFLYLLAARHARLSHQVFQQDHESALLLPPPPLPPQTFPAHAAAANGPASLEQRPYATLPPRLHTSSTNGELRNIFLFALVALK